MKKLMTAIFALVMLGTNAFGFSYSLYDFGDASTAFDHNNNWSPIDYPYGVGHQPSPGSYGEGGEKFDLEGLNVAMDDDYIYLSMTNSFGYMAYSDEYTQDYRLGDLFIGVDGGDKYGFAIDLVDGGAAGLYQVDSWSYVQDDPGSYNYNNYSPSITNAVGAHEITTGTLLGGVTSAVTFWQGLEQNYMSPGDGDTYVWEFVFDRSLLGDFQTLDFHLTLGCGNDLLEESYAVPEPATMFLFGLGLIGYRTARKRGWISS